MKKFNNCVILDRGSKGYLLILRDASNKDMVGFVNFDELSELGKSKVSSVVETALGNATIRQEFTIEFDSAVKIEEYEDKLYAKPSQAQLANMKIA